VLVTCGVNDAVRHVGAKAYSEGMLRLVGMIRKAGAVPVLLELPRLGKVRAPSWRSAVKRWWNRWVRDDGQHDVTDRYRAELLRVYPGLMVRLPQLRRSDIWHDPAHINGKGRALVACAFMRALLGR